MRFVPVALLLLSACVPFAPVRRQDSAVKLKKEGKIMDLEELTALLKEAKKKGEPLKGHGQSVFEGTQPERFEIEILDIMKNFIYPKYDLILFRGSHPRWLDGGNVIAGMSGSPCFVGDKLIGALSYTMGFFEKDPLGGITPIEYMLHEMDRPVEQHGFAPPRLENGMVPVRTPLYVSGFGARGVKALEKAFGEEGPFVVAQGGTGSAVIDAPDTFVSGGAIGGQLMGGDYDITGTGTVTYVDGEHVLAFGHPFFSAGEFEMPITTAVVHTTFRGMQRAYKISSPGPVKGSLIHDRSHAIYGKIGKAPRMIPIHMTLSNPNVGTRKEVNFHVVYHKSWTPMLINMGILNTIDAFEPSQKTKVTHSKMAIRLKSGRTLRFEEINQEDEGGGGFFFFFGGGGGGIIGKFSQLIENEYADPAIESVDIDTVTVNEDRSVSIRDAVVLTPEVEDGGTVRVRLRLKKWRGPETYREAELTLPKGLKEGTEINVVVGGGSSIAPERAPDSNLEELLAALEKEYRPTNLVMSADLPSYNLMYKGKILDRFPASALAPLVPSLQETAYLGNTTVRNVVETDWIVNGSVSFKVRIKQRGVR